MKVCGGIVIFPRISTESEPFLHKILLHSFTGTEGYDQGEVSSGCEATRRSPNVQVRFSKIHEYCLWYVVWCRLSSVPEFPSSEHLTINKKRYIKLAQNMVRTHHKFSLAIYSTYKGTWTVDD